MTALNVRSLALASVALTGVIFLCLAFIWRAERDHLHDWQLQVVLAISDAADLKDSDGRPAKLAPRDVPQQIRFLGAVLKDARVQCDNARADDAGSALAVKERQQFLSQEASDDSQARLAALRADFDRRSQKARAAAADWSWRSSVSAQRRQRPRQT